MFSLLLPSFAFACARLDSTAPTPSGTLATTDAGSSSGPGTASDASGPFAPSNLVLDGLDLSRLGDVDLRESCTIQTDVDGSQDCFLDAAAVSEVVQSDGSKLHVVVLRSLVIEPSVSITVTGSVPLALVALGDMSILGRIQAHAASDVAGAGAFGPGAQNEKGMGPGGGPPATGASGAPGAGAGGGSFCGRGGLGALEPGATGEPGAPSAGYGTPLLVPLIGGSAGGSGSVGAGAGGGAIELVSMKTFTLGAGGVVDVGGGGGPFAGTVGQEAGGGGSGGAILIEGANVTIAGVLAANGGGGGGGSADGRDATPDDQIALGGEGSSRGGAGAASHVPDGANGTPGAAEAGAGAGGGGAGRIRINSRSGAAQLAAATISPALDTPCATEGTVH